MTKETLAKNISFINQQDSYKELQMFGFIKGDAAPYKLNIDKNMEVALIKVFVSGVKTNIVDAEYSIVKFSTADERKKRYYEYDLDIPEELKPMKDVIGNANIPYYDLNNHGISELDHLIVVLSDGDKCFTIYKQLSTVEKIARTSSSILAKIGIDRTQIVEEEKTLLRIGPSFQLIYVADKYIILNDKFFESHFKVLDILNNEAMKNIKTIKDTNLLLDFKKLKKYKGTTAFSRKLVKVLKNSLIIKKQVLKADVISFIENDIELKDKLTIEEKDGEKFISISSKESAVAFLDLLNDEFVYSALTKQNYKAPDKDLR